MRSPYFTEEHDILREQVRRFVISEVMPHGDAWERDGAVPREVFLKMGELGFLGLRFPEALGGSGMSVLGLIILAEELGRSTYAGMNLMAMVHVAMASPHLLNAGTQEQLERYAAGIISGRTLTGVAITEPDAGSDVGGLRTSARRDGDEWIIDGSKMFISNGLSGDLFFVAARTDRSARGHRGISMFIVPKGIPGFAVGRRLAKMGHHCADTVELIFDNCRVPHANLLGEAGRGFYAVMKNFQSERLILGAMATGEAATALKITIDYTRIRQTFGVPLLDRQTIRQRLAMLHAKVEAGRQLLYHAGWLEAQGQSPVREVSMVKAFCAETVNEVMYACQQFHGGIGYIQGTAIERMVRDARLYAIGGGATEIMLEEIAKRWDSVPYWQ